MSVRDIRLFGDPVLREACRPVTDVGAGLARLVTDLTETCRALRAGPGSPPPRSAWTCACSVTTLTASRGT